MTKLICTFFVLFSCLFVFEHAHAYTAEQLAKATSMQAELAQEDGVLFSLGSILYGLYG
jgi:predicted membrane channel-forming protein YqfA (hemolysin III family)